MAVTAADVRLVAELARLRVDDGAVPAIVDQLNGILAHMEVLQQVNVSGIGESPVDASMPLRDPSAEAVALDQGREAFAPAIRDGFFLVPRLATHEGQGAAADA